MQEMISIKPMQDCRWDQKQNFPPNFSPSYWDNKNPFFVPLIPHPNTISKSFKPLYKVDGGLIELLQFYVPNNL